jgi:hypothetical protein
VILGAEFCSILKHNFMIPEVKVVVIPKAELHELIRNAMLDQGTTYTIQEAAQALKLSVASVRKLIAENLLIPSYVGNTKRIIISQGAINAFHNAQRVRK